MTAKTPGYYNPDIAPDTLEALLQFPFIDDAHNLHFASDGHVCFGGLDIFKV
ncbi:hypothetical protein [Deminuibacter soli]|uniref:hypothetical protein n=1 Tax=Deminuibacter soli TaxID=2291815 RepID=UPI001313FC0C|nr:hypothetical protein [Deminuibacter soli]